MARPAPRRTPPRPQGPSSAPAGKTRVSFIQEITPLLVGDRQPRALHHLEQVVPDQSLLFVGRLAQNVAGMISDHERLAAKFVPTPPGLPQGLEFAEAQQPFEGGLAERD